MTVEAGTAPAVKLDTANAREFERANLAAAAMYRAARLPVMHQIIEKLWLRAGPFLNIVRSDVTYGLGLDHHNEMLAALRRADGTGARRALVADLMEAVDIILRAPAAAEAQPVRSRSARRDTAPRARVR